jgi:ABC-2 type transport system permease protein
VTSPAPAIRSLAALLRVELLLATRRAENVLVTIVIPTAVLAFFASTAVLPIPGRAVDVLLPGSIALGLLASGLVSLGIATGYERGYGVLKRLGGAPIPRWTVLAAKVAGIAAVELLQVALLVGMATAVLDWRPGSPAAPLVAVAGLALGTVTFSGLGLAMAGALRPEATLAVANGAFIALLLVGGIVLPIDHLAEPLRSVADILPTAPLVELLGIGLGTGPAAGGDPVAPLALLAGWAAASSALAVRAFRWE